MGSEQLSRNKAFEFIKSHTDELEDYIKSTSTGKKQIDCVSFDWDKSEHIHPQDKLSHYQNIRVYCYVNNHKKEEVCLWVIEKEHHNELSIEGIGIAKAKSAFREKYLDGAYKLLTGENISQ